MTEKEAIEIFEKAHSLQEQIDMKKDLESIHYVLSQNPINMVQVMSLIEKINKEHPENITIFNLIYPPQGNSVPLYAASDENMISDLKWKWDYLQAKQTGKIFEEFRKAITQGNQNGGLM